MAQSQAMSPLWTRDELNMDAWSQMEWFVRLGRADKFGTMPAWEQLKWQEECAAMYLRGAEPVIPAPVDTKRYSRYPTGMRSDTPLGCNLPTLEHLQEARDAIAPHLTALADGRGTDLGPFPITLTVSFHHVHDAYGRQHVPRHLIYRGETTEPVANPFHASLLRHMTRLLEIYCDQIRRCPRSSCQRVFLQTRRHQEYCSRQCQSIAVMQKRRATDKKTLSSQLKGKQTGHKKERRSPHGKKGR